MRIIIEDTNQETENKQRGIIECEQDGIEVDNIMSLVIRTLLAYGYDRAVIAEWFKEIALSYHSKVSELNKSATSDEE